MNHSPEKIERIYYIFNGRFPSEKAHALYVAKVCEAFSNKNFNVTLVVPRRFRTSKENYVSFFGIPESFKVVYIPTLDTYSLLPNKIAFFLHYACFTVCTFWYLLVQPKTHALLFSHDSVISSVLTLLSKNVVYEIHDYPGKYRFMFRFLFKRVRLIITQNQLKKDSLIQEFAIDGTHILVEPNAVALEKFSIDISAQEARKKLSLPEDIFLVLYTGHLFKWKGVGVLAEAAKLCTSNIVFYFVGGSDHDVVSFREKYSSIPNIVITGHKPHTEIPLWQKAANCVVLPNTATEAISNTQTSPMKLFEYMASKRPIVASDIASIRSVVSKREVTFVEPDAPQALASAFEEIKLHPELYSAKTEAAYERVRTHTWEKRAERILEKLTV